MSFVSCSYFLATNELATYTHEAAGSIRASGLHTHTITMNKTGKSGNDTVTVCSYYENFNGRGNVDMSITCITVITACMI